MDDSDVFGDTEVISIRIWTNSETENTVIGSIFNFANRLPSSWAWPCSTDSLFWIGGSQRWCQDAASNDEFGGEDQAILKHFFLRTCIKVLMAFDGFLLMLLRFHHLMKRQTISTLLTANRCWACSVVNNQRTRHFEFIMMKRHIGKAERAAMSVTLAINRF